MNGTTQPNETAIKMGWYDLIKKIHHAIQYGLHCNDMNHKEVMQEIVSSLDMFAKKNDLPVHDWNTPYGEQY